MVVVITKPRPAAEGIFAARCRSMKSGTGWPAFGNTFWVLIGLFEDTPRAQKIRQPSSGGGQFRGEFLFGRSFSRTSTLAGQGILPSPTTGCRIRLTESLLTFRNRNSPGQAVCQIHRLAGSECARNFGPIALLAPNSSHEVGNQNLAVHFHHHVSRFIHDSSMG